MAPGEDRSPTPPSQAEPGTTPAAAEATPQTRNRAASLRGAVAMMLAGGLAMVITGLIAGSDQGGTATLLCGLGGLGIGLVAAAGVFPPRIAGLLALAAGVAIAASSLLEDSFSTASWGRLLGGAVLFMAGAGLAATADRPNQGDREPQTRFRS